MLASIDSDAKKDMDKKEETPMEIFMKKLGFFLKIMTMFLFVCLIPLLPWIALSFYTFKKIANHINTSIVSM